MTPPKIASGVLRPSGFTLIEVMITVAILSCGTVMIQYGLLRSANVLGHTSNTLQVQNWMNDKIWDVKEALFYSENPPPEDQSGSFNDAAREFQWTMHVEPAMVEQELYLLRLTVTWLEGGRPALLVRELYATNKKK